MAHTVIQVPQILLLQLQHVLISQATKKQKQNNVPVNKKQMLCTFF